jgi:glycosyltransferase involved in cell wall biosynthesis
MLCVGTLEGRKNHLALLEACTTLWDRGLHFRLHLVGGCHAHTGRAALERVRALQASGRPLRYDGPATDEALEAAYAESSFTIYPSLAEGFGLPVAESLARGRVCLCRTTGALGEIARAGGCVDLGGASAQDIAAALEPLITSAQALAALEAVALQQRFRDWSAYAADLTAWMASLGR